MTDLTLDMHAINACAGPLIIVAAGSQQAERASPPHHHARGKPAARLLFPSMPV